MPLGSSGRAQSPDTAADNDDLSISPAHQLHSFDGSPLDSRWCINQAWGMSTIDLGQRTREILSDLWHETYDDGGILPGGVRAIACPDTGTLSSATAGRSSSRSSHRVGRPRPGHPGSRISRSPRPEGSGILRGLTRRLQSHFASKGERKMEHRQFGHKGPQVGRDLRPCLRPPRSTRHTHCMTATGGRKRAKGNRNECSVQTF
jgi:hypothetical protein